jgi:hypothetical protein
MSFLNCAQHDRGVTVARQEPRVGAANSEQVSETTSFGVQVLPSTQDRDEALVEALNLCKRSNLKTAKLVVVNLEV